MSTVVSAIIIGVADMQGLVDVGDQMQQPGQGIRNIVVFPGQPQQMAEAFDLPVNFPFVGLTALVQIDVMPILVARGIGKAGERRRGVIASLVMEARVVADVVGPG